MAQAEELLLECNRKFIGCVCQKIECENGKIAVYFDNGYKFTVEGLAIGYAAHKAFSTATSQYETSPCQPNCPLCLSGAGHTSVRRIPDLDSVSQSPKFSPTPNFGTHISEALDIVADWWRGLRSNA